MKIDIGRYNANPDLYRRLVEEMYAANPPITLGSEYAEFITNNQLRLLIRLARYKFAARLLKPTDAVLEVGSGSGLGAIFLGQHCREVLGLEIKSTELEEARALNRRANVSFSDTDFFEHPSSRKFDAIVALDVIEHIPANLTSRFIAKAASLLSPSGMLIIGTPSLYSYPYQGPLSQASHEKCYDLPELEDLVRQGFGRTLPFSMNDELVHTGNHRMAWYYFVIGVAPQVESAK